ncbi:hypothetical protein EYZ11_006441 [Aspergillus tanneri]|uniref:Uncharacterized protein n=1 Tax=Aspergillus tanneri TaxID=1220188 RepID=A0A4S3JL98_9EURO|nr:hypothetical protein EYZ11_006441 [Aspergillus tanneri]
MEGKSSEVYQMKFRCQIFS